MFKYLFYFFALLSVNNFSTFAMTPLDELETSGTIKVYFENRACALTRDDLTGVKFISPTSTVPYVLPNRKSHSYPYATGIRLEISLKQFGNVTTSIEIPIPQHNKRVLVHEFKFDDKAKLVQISAQMHASISGGGRVNLRGEWENDGNDVEYADLASTWDSLKPGLNNRLQKDGYCLFFNINSLENNLYFGCNWTKSD